PMVCFPFLAGVIIRNIVIGLSSPEKYITTVFRLPEPMAPHEEPVYWTFSPVSRYSIVAEAVPSPAVGSGSGLSEGSLLHALNTRVPERKTRLNRNDNLFELFIVVIFNK